MVTCHRTYRFLVVIVSLTIIVVVVFNHRDRIARTIPKLSQILLPRLNHSGSHSTQHDGAVTMQEVFRLNEGITQPPPYQDPKVLKNCKISERRFSTFHLLKQWMKIAAKHNITWFLTAGTSLASLRHNDFTPYDYDVDIAILDKHEKLMRKLAVKERKKMNRTVPNIVVRVNTFCWKLHWVRKNCRDETVMSQVDQCAFCGPVARLIYKAWAMDIFEIRPKKEKGKLVYRDESMDTQSRLLPHSSYFPLIYCKFIGLTVPCVRNRTEYAKLPYGDIRPVKVCKNGRWVPR